MSAPITLTLPWACVLHDNHRLMPVVVKGRARLIQTPAYRTAKAAAALRLRAQWRGPQLTGDVLLIARVYVPDRRKRDPGNYRKLVTDAATGICYGDDAQLCYETWLRAGVDRDNPRIDVVLMPPDATLDPLTLTPSPV